MAIDTNEEFDIDAMIAEVTANEEEEIVVNTVEGEASEAKSKSGGF